MEKVSLGTVFLVDDDRSVNFYNKWVLEQSASVETVYEFESSEAAMYKFKELMEAGVGVDLILLDLNLPGMNGFECVGKCIQEGYIRNAEKVVMLLNSELLKEQLDIAASLGIKHFLNKPLQFEELEAILRAD